MADVVNEDREERMTKVEFMNNAGHPVPAIAEADDRYVWHWHQPARDWLPPRANPVEAPVWSLGGVPWYEAPAPPRWHRHVPHSVGWFEPGDAVSVCPCGAIRAESEGWWARPDSPRIGSGWVRLLGRRMLRRNPVVGG